MQPVALGHGARRFARRLTTGSLVPVVWLTILLAVALSTGWPERAIALRIWLVGVGLVGLHVLVALVGRQPSVPRRDAFDVAARDRPPEPPPPPPSFVETGRLIEVIAGTAGDLHFRVRPVLREVAAERLLTRHGLLLDAPADGPEAAACCGPLLWDVVRPDRPEPPDRRRRDLDRRDACEIVQRLEAL